MSGSTHPPRLGAWQSTPSTIVATGASLSGANPGTPAQPLVPTMSATTTATPAENVPLRSMTDPRLLFSRRYPTHVTST
ncbi:hypothetical protein [Cryobacterium roopkundense]|uniref:Uncharacterized protein n=1 Tax=Cryobacterium roopkundense TaxID=1001240 RepID=A0A7W8ZZB8_9MICO|nr:hypothetical protein [Cryobacterium roopkundense]MBB5642690.1 hypothetical protein [Cryobacterium roopkundense]